MKNQITFVLCVVTAFCPSSRSQTITVVGDEASASASSSPAAFVYVARTVSGGSENEIDGFAAAANGKLTRVAGSPFQENVKSIAESGKFLFATNSEGTQIEAFRIESNGALRYATTTEVDPASQSGTLGPLFLDRIGESLYDTESNVGAYGNYTYQSFAVDNPIGGLKSTGSSIANSWLNLPASFIANNLYAYSATCLQNMYWGIFGFKRSSSGLLKDIDPQATTPAGRNGDFYCPSLTATDLSNHVAISMQPIGQTDFAPDGAAQLATYTAHSGGTLTTASTLANMPTVSVGSVKDLSMAPSGKLLAVAGSGGLEVFHFNGAEPITHDTGLLTKDAIDQIVWDNTNHLYAISRAAGKLFVFTVSPTSYKQAPGSPYSIESPQNIVVQPEL